MHDVSQIFIVLVGYLGTTFAHLVIVFCCRCLDNSSAKTKNLILSQLSGCLLNLIR